MRYMWVKLALVFMAVGAGAIVFSTVLSVREMDRHFSLYLEQLHRKHAHEVVTLLQDHYQLEGRWSEQTAQTLAAVANVLDVQVVVYDSRLRPLPSFASGQNLLVTDEKIPVVVAGETVGYVSLAHYHATETSQLERHFQDAHTYAMLTTMLVLILMLGVASVMLARRIARPIVAISKASKAAAGGDLTVRVPLPGGKDERTELVSSFNQLITTLQMQDELRRRLTSDIAHELRTPLNTLLAQVEGMIDGVWEANPKHLESVRQEILRLTGLVHDLDLVIRTEAGLQSMETERFDLGEAVREVSEAMLPAFEREGVVLTAAVQPNAWLAGDRKRICQVISNLLSNSLKHTPAGGWTHVSAKREKGSLIVRVKDNGVGISEKDLPFVFERFYRGDISRQRGTGGTGLGLTIVKGIVEAHRGQIRIDSRAGEGTMVTITLPESPDLANTASKPSGSSQRPTDKPPDEPL